MRGDDDAEFLCQLERAIKFRVVHAKRTFVGEKDFERADASLHNFAELFLGPVVEFRHAHVKREIARGFADGVFHPKFETLQRVVLAAGAAHFDERRRAADERSLAAGHVGVLRKRAHERQINVDMRINEAGENKFPFRVNHLRAVRWREVAVNVRDGFVFAQDVGHVAFARGHDFAIFNQYAHNQTPNISVFLSLINTRLQPGDLLATIS